MPEFNVTVSRVAYPPQTADPDNWYILITDTGTAKGKIAWRPQEREQLTLEAEWVSYKGERQLSFQSARLNLPTNPRDQLRYVCNRTKGLGSAAESLIWSHLGEDWRNLKSGEVQRISGRIYENFLIQIEALTTKGEESRVIATLMGKGATINMATSAWGKWEKDTLGVVNSDCYRLSELESYGFKDVDDKIRKEYGIEDADPRRIRSGIVYALRRLTDRGDTVVEWDELYKHAVGILGGFGDLIGEQTGKMFEDGTLRAFEGSKGVALTGDYKAEVMIWDFVNQKMEVVEMSAIDKLNG